MTKSAFSDDTPADEPTVDPSWPTSMVVIVLVGLLVILTVWLLRPVEEIGLGTSHPSVGRTMGDFQLAPLVGDTDAVTLESLRGEIVLLNFWGTWCPPCMIEFPHLIEINDRLKSDKRFRFVPISCGPGGGEAAAEQLRAATAAYLARLNTDLNVYRDPGGGARLSVMNSAQLPGFAFPTTILLDRDGTIAAFWQGYAPGMETDMEAAIRALLKS